MNAVMASEDHEGLVTWQAAPRGAKGTASGPAWGARLLHAFGMHAGMRAHGAGLHAAEHDTGMHASKNRHELCLHAVRREQRSHAARQMCEQCIEEQSMCSGMTHASRNGP
eukprot:355094-Chlamydomonas_euryale.AAC.2